MAKPWTDEETEILQEMYPLHGFDIDKWDKSIDRSTNAIKAQAWRMGISDYHNLGLTEEQRTELFEGFIALCSSVRCRPLTAFYELKRIIGRGHV